MYKRIFIILSLVLSNLIISSCSTFHSYGSRKYALTYINNEWMKQNQLYSSENVRVMKKDFPTVVDSINRVFSKLGLEFMEFNSNLYKGILFAKGGYENILTKEEWASIIIKEKNKIENPYWAILKTELSEDPKDYHLTLKVRVDRFNGQSRVELGYFLFTKVDNKPNQPVPEVLRLVSSKFWRELKKDLRE
jgi:hypothetical protein